MANMKNTEEFKLPELKSKNKKSLREIFDYYYFSLCAYAYSYIPEYETVEDFVQEAFIKAWNNWEHFENTPAVKSYLYMCVRNASINYMKHSSMAHRHEKEITTFLFFDEEDDEWRIGREELYARLYESIQQLPERSKEVILASLEGLDMNDVAARMKISLNSAKTLKKRGYAILRLKLKDFTWVLILFY